eukprot:CAMPEP_0114666246 /NCGR_PEP_ID=MMETSP0191-20121206/32246_1 /TAXON_ID=126664 /ORGANISM="Sorites sp." /LENGTH=93 /DNA_ID=CAMNT_0001913457 /DNA_START=311 /DNA_END=589 /DNA_ORIENTATION=+
MDDVNGGCRDDDGCDDDDDDDLNDTDNKDNSIDREPDEYIIDDKQKIRDNVHTPKSAKKVKKDFTVSPKIEWAPSMGKFDENIHVLPMGNQMM